LLETQSARHVPQPALKPGDWLGLLGGGQLGRMFCMAAHTLGYKVCVLDPGADSPAGAVADRHIQADYEDPQALAELARLCRAATTEFENVPAGALEYLADHCVVSPAGASVAIAQDRIVEKAFVRDCGIAVAPYAEIRSKADLEAADASLFPAILKAARLGYDGKGQARVDDAAQAIQAFEGFGGVACVLEKRLDLAKEVSVVVARGFDGRTAVFPVCENEHRGGILAVSISPARISNELAARAMQAADQIVQAMNYVGVLCVEFFVLADGALVVNEMAPRPHNSGHYTIDACVSSQFEQQARVMAGLPLGSVRQHEPSVMINLLGDIWFRGPDPKVALEPDWTLVLRHPQARLHLYGKSDARRGRKMGHVTVLGETVEDALRDALQIERALGIIG